MRPYTLQQIEAAIRAAWSRETCDPVDLPDWSATNPARGQCGGTALVINDLLGGDLLTAVVLRVDGSQQGHHSWNRLAGVEIDLTREQFLATEIVQAPKVVIRPADREPRAAEQYHLLRRRVLDALAAGG